MGLLREVFYGLAILYNRSNDQKPAQAYLQLSGFDAFDKPITLTTPYAVNASKGHTFYPERDRPRKVLQPAATYAQAKDIMMVERTPIYHLAGQDRLCPSAGVMLDFAAWRHRWQAKLHWSPEHPEGRDEG